MLNNKQIEQEAKRFEAMYPEHIDALQERFKKDYGENKKWSSTFDSYAFGKYAENFESFLPMMEEDPTTRQQLGDVLKSGLDLVLSSYATLPMQFIASIQPMTQEVGVAYYRSAIATSTRGGVNSGDVLIGESGQLNSGIGEYMSENQVSQSKVTAADGLHTIDLMGPVRGGSVRISIGQNKITAIEDGQGHVFGVGIDPDKSSIDYRTGKLVLKLTGGIVAVNDLISASYTQLMLDSLQIPSFKWDLRSKPIIAQYWGLQASYSSIADLVVRRQFGNALSEELVKDTVSQINGAVLYRSISLLRKAALENEVVTGGYVWAKTPAPGVSPTEHRQTIVDALEDTTKGMELVSGKGGVSFIIAGAEARKIFRTLGVGGNKAANGPYLLGFFDGVPVFYAPAAILPGDEMLVGYRGEMWFDSPLVYAPFIPVTTVTTAGQPNNVFINNVGVAHGAGLDVVTKGFVQRVKIA